MALTKESQMEYARSKNVEDRIALATYPYILPEVVDYMLEHEEILAVKRSLLKHPNSNVSTETLAKVARREKDEDVLASVALHLNTDTDTLEYLAGLNMRHLNWAVASNPNTKQKVLEVLAYSKVDDVRHAVFLNPNTPEETRERLEKEFKGSFWSAESWYDHHGIVVVASGN